MKERTELLIDGMRETRTKRHRWLAMVTALAFLTGGNVFWSLREIGMAVTEEDLCTLEAHTHSEECYDADGNLICGKEEHVHTAACFSDENADLETAEIWEATLPELDGLSRQEQVALIAESQLGYAESANNFILGEDGTQHGYTRYGAWYGNPYGEWNTMFTYFCLYYAGVSTEEIPCTGNARTWQVKLSECGLIRGPDTEPERGGIVLLDLDADGEADLTGIVTDAAETLHFVEGDLGHAVAEGELAPDAEQILGYVSIPEPDPPDTENPEESPPDESPPENTEESPPDAEPAPTEEQPAASESEQPLVTYRAEAPSGIQVCAVAAEGVFPTDTVMTVTDVPREEALQAAAEGLSAGAEALDAVAVDISFYAADGTELEPAGGVDVQITLPETQQLAGENYTLLHVADDGAVQTVENVALGCDHAEFETDSFSTYVIASLDTDGTYLKWHDIGYVNSRYFGVNANSAEKPYIMYIGDELELISEEGIQFWVMQDNTAKTIDRTSDGRDTPNTTVTYTDDKGVEHSITGLHAKYEGLRAGDCVIHVKLNNEGAERLIYVRVKQPIYVKTEFDDKPTNKTREWLKGFGLTNYDGYVPNTRTEPLLLRVGDTMDMYTYSSDGIWVYPCQWDETEKKWLDSLDGYAEPRISYHDEPHDADNYYAWSVTGLQTGLSCIKVGDEKVYIYVIGDETINSKSYYHADMEIADGGQYTLSNVTYENGQKITTVDVYDAYVSKVNHAVVYNANDTVLSEFDPENYEQIGGEGGTQYELTSAFLCNGRSDKKYDINEVKHVEFNVDITLIPKTRYVIKDSGTTSSSIADQLPITIGSQIYDLGQQQIIDAMNKCPLKNGLDFTIQPNAALIRVEAIKQLDTGATPPDDTFTFAMSECSYSFHKMPAGDGTNRTYMISGYNPTHTYEAYRLNLLVGGSGWGDGIDGDGFWNTGLNDYKNSVFYYPQNVGTLIEKYADHTNTAADFDQDDFVTLLLPYLKPENAVRPDSNGVLSNMTGDFILIDISETVSTAKNKANGVVLLDQTYMETGLHRYAVHEVIPDGDTSYIFDNRTHYITVQVSHEANAENCLSAVVTGNRPEFRNTVTYRLPDTGGVGTLPWYLGGTVILAAASLLMIKKRREGS